MFGRGYRQKEIRGIVFEGDKADEGNGLKGIGVKLFTVKDTHTENVNDGSRVTIYKEKLAAQTTTDEKGEYRFYVNEGSYSLSLDVQTLPDGKSALNRDVFIDRAGGDKYSFAIKNSPNTITGIVSRKAPVEFKSPNESSIDKINLAYKRGNIDEQRKILLYIHTMFEGAKLSKEYSSGIPVKSGTTAVKEIYDYINRDDADRGITQSAIQYMEDAIPALDRAYTSPSGYFKIHYTASGQNAVALADSNGNKIPDYIESIGAAFDNSKSITCDERGFRRPILDDGKDAFDVYVYDLKGKYGVTFPSKLYSSDNPNDGPRRASGYIAIDNSYSAAKGFKKGRDDCMKVTAAHEFFHAVQYAYNVDSDSWWKEASATWNEDEIYDNVNDYFQYLRGFFSSPEKSLEQNSYGGVVFAKYLSEKHGGYGMIKRIWEMQGSAARNSIEAIDRAIRESYKRESIGTVYNAFAACNYNPAQYYREGSLWESSASIQNTFTAYPVVVQNGKLNHLSANYQIFVPEAALTGRKLRIIVDGAEKMRWGFKIQKRRISDNRCDITEITTDGLANRVEILCEFAGGTYKEICLIPTNLEKDRDDAQYSYCASVQ